MRSGLLFAFPLAVFVALAASSAPARAQQFGAEVFGAFNTYQMEDWNDEIDLANEGGADIDEINGGFGGGLGLRFWPNSSFMISGVWEPLFVTREDDVSGGELKLDGNSVQGTIAWFFPSASMARYGLGAGVGYYMLNGELSGVTTTEVEGTGIGFHVMGLGEWTVSPGFAVTAGAGYRMANIEDTEFDGVGEDPEFETDYSGLMVRLGLAFYLGSNNSSSGY